MTDKLETLIQRLEKATIKLEGFAVASPAFSAPQDSSSDGPALAAFDELLQGAYKDFIAHSKTIGGLVSDQAGCIERAVEAERKLVATAIVSKQPDQKTVMELIKPLQKELAAIAELKEKNRPSPLFSHLSMVADGIPALGWVVVTPTPGPYINEMKDAAQFYANRVIKESKEKDPVHVKWVQSFSAFLVELFGYVKKWHTTGLAWNPRGGDALQASASSQPAPATQATPAPAPAAASAPKPVVDLLGGLAKGTSGLRKVEKSEMTHKNPELRATSIVPASSEKPVAAKAAAAKTTPKGPPKLALEGNKWVVENQVNNAEVVIEKTELKQVVYIYNCHNSTIKVQGKVNAITIDGCKKVGVLIENVVSTLDTVNSQKVQIQITGKCPTAAVDKTDGYQLYLSKECLDLQLLSAKSTEMNVLFPNAAGEFTEMPVVEQFKTYIKDGKLITEAVEHKGD